MVKTRRILYLFLSFLLLTVVFLPHFFRTEWGRDALNAMISARISGRIECTKISLSWFGNQLFEGTKYWDADGNLVLSADHINTSNGLVSALFRKSLQGKYAVYGLQADLTAEGEALKIYIHMREVHCLG